MADEIMNLVDEHLAWQVEAEERENRRRGSVGTLVVDWDGTGEMRVFHRGEKEKTEMKSRQSQQSAVDTQSRSLTSSRPSHQLHCHYQAPTRASKARSQSPSRKQPRNPTLPRCSSTTVNFHRHTNSNRIHTSHDDDDDDDDLTIQYSPTSNTAHGYDPSTLIAYQYNGRNLYVHNNPHPNPTPTTTPTNSPLTPRIAVSFPIPVERYLANKQKALPALPIPQDDASAKKEGKVVGFVKKVMGKLERVGVLGKMRARREREGYVISRLFN
jgi:hypothetical protein